MERGIRFNKFWIFVWGIFFMIVIIIAVTALFSQKQTTTGSNPGETAVKSLTCESDSYYYPFFKYDNSTKKHFKIVATFSDQAFRTISLQQMLYYNDEEETKNSEALNHAAMNISFSERGMDADALGANYAMLKEGLRFSLYGEYEHMKTNEVDYFLLGESNSYDYEYLKSTYEGLGMKCASTNVK